MLDQCSSVGIEISDLSDHAMIDIADAYVSPAPGAKASISFDRARGLTTIRGGQILCGLERGAPAILASDSDGIDLAGLKILDSHAPVLMTRCRDFSLGVAINLPDGGARGPAVMLSDCADGVVTARVKGPAGAFTAGVSVTGPGTRSLAIDTSAIGADAVGGEQRRVTWTGVANGAVRLR